MTKLEELTVKEIKEMLDAKGIEYDSKAKKDDLIGLVADKTDVKYVAIVDFKDLQDGDKVYRKDEPYPHANASASDDRIKELLSSDNKLGKPVIKEVE